MPLNTEGLRTTLKTKIKEAFDAPIDEKSDSNKVKQELANAIADGVDAWIKTATVTVQAGITVATAGSPTAQTGATTSPGTGTIS